ncbi:MAG: hypothetical protein ACRDHW_04895 [Ktedonobacteraceae bacterium]
MSSPAPTCAFALSREQASRLQAYLQGYRCHAFASLAPSMERNNALRRLQSLQSKLIDILDHKTKPSGLVLTMEDVAILRTMAAELLLLSTREPASAERNATLADLAALKGYLARFAEK